MLVSAGAAHVDMTAELGGAAQLDGREHATLGERQAHLGLELWAVPPHDVGDVEARPPGECRCSGHFRYLSSLSSGLLVCAIIFVDTRV